MVLCISARLGKRILLVSMQVSGGSALLMSVKSLPCHY